MDDYTTMLRRRLWVLLIPVVLTPVGAYLFSRALSDRYTSKTLVLVEQQKVPESFVRPVVTENIGGRLGMMREQILSRTRLQPIIERFGLFKDELRKAPMEDLVERLRSDISVMPMRSMMEGRAGDLPGFIISFTASNARLAQQVCAEITSMFMEENLRSREQRSQGTTDFLKTQLDEAKRKQDEQDARLAAFKTKYFGALPGGEQTNLNLIQGLTAQLDAVTQSLSRAQQDKSYTEAVLAQMVAGLRPKTTTSPEPSRLVAQLAAMQTLLGSMQARYTDEHPDVVKVKNDIAQVKKRLEEETTLAPPPESSESQAPPLPEPPELQQLRTQIHQLGVTMREKGRDQERLRGQISVIQSRLNLSPVVEQQYKELTRDYQTALDFYKELLVKKSQSEMTTNLERRQQGEQFRVMDPASLPEKPSFPDRPLIAAGGLGVGLALGLAIVLLLEYRDKFIRTERDVEFFLEMLPLAQIPQFASSNGRKFLFWKRGEKAGATPGRNLES